VIARFKGFYLLLEGRSGEQRAAHNRPVSHPQAILSYLSLHASLASSKSRRAAPSALPRWVESRERKTAHALVENRCFATECRCELPSRLNLVARPYTAKPTYYWFPQPSSTLRIVAQSVRYSWVTD